MPRKPLTKAEKAYVRTETRLAIAGAIIKLFEELQNEKRLNQAALAERLGVSRSRVNTLVTAPGNWTLDTVADLLAAMDAKLTNVEVKLRADIVCHNSLHDWQLPERDSRFESRHARHWTENQISLPQSGSQPKIRQWEIAS